MSGTPSARAARAAARSAESSAAAPRRHETEYHDADEQRREAA